MVAHCCSTYCTSSIESAPQEWCNPILQVLWPKFGICLVIAYHRATLNTVLCFVYSLRIGALVKHFVAIGLVKWWKHFYPWSRGVAKFLIVRNRTSTHFGNPKWLFFRKSSLCLQTMPHICRIPSQSVTQYCKKVCITFVWILIVWGTLTASSDWQNI